MKQLGDLTEPVRTWNPSRVPDIEFDYIDLSAVDNLTKRVTEASRVIGANAPSRARQLVASEDVLVSTVRPNLNAVATIPSSLDGATASTGFTVLRPGKMLDSRFLYHWVQSSGFINDMVRKSTGASYPAVSDRIVKESLIPHLNLDEQRRIAAILDRASEVRTKRRRVVTYLDTLPRSIVEEMVEREAAPIRQLHELAAISSGITKGRRTVRPTTPVPYLAVANVQFGRLKLDAIKTIDATDDEVGRYALRDGDLVLTEGGDPDKLGRGTVWRGELPLCLHQNHIFKVRADQAQILPEYLSAYLGSAGARAYFLRNAKQTTGIASINMHQLRAIPIPVPPIGVQSVLVERLTRIARTRSSAVSAGEADDELFASLQARAFRGEL